MEQYETMSEKQGKISGIQYGHTKTYYGGETTIHFTSDMNHKAFTPFIKYFTRIYSQFKLFIVISF